MANGHVVGVSASGESRGAGFALRFGLVMLAASLADSAAVNTGSRRVQDRQNSHATKKVVLRPCGFFLA